MKKMCLLILIVLYILPGNAQYIKTLQEQQKVFGKVSSIAEIKITEKAYGTKPDSLIIMTKYDKKGNTIKEVYTEINHLAPNVTTYDMNGKETVKKDTKDISTFNYTISYTNKTKKATCKTGIETYVYTFNKRGLLTRYDKYQTDGQLVSKNYYKYDYKNRLIEYDGCTNKDSLVNKTTYIYNDKDLLIESEQYYPLDFLESKSEYSYLEFDKNGNWMKRLTNSVNTNTANYTYTEKIIDERILRFYK